MRSIEPDRAPERRHGRGRLPGRRRRPGREPAPCPTRRGRRLLRGPLQGRRRQLGPPRHHVDLLPAAEGSYSAPDGSLVPAYERVHRARTASTARRSTTPPATRPCSSSPHPDGRDARRQRRRIRDGRALCGSAVMPGIPATTADEADVAVAVDGNRRALRRHEHRLPVRPGLRLHRQAACASVDCGSRTRANGPGGDENGTVVDTLLEMPLTCVGTGGVDGRSDLRAEHHARCADPGSRAREGTARSGRLGQVTVRDAGPNGTGYGAGCPSSLRGRRRGDLPAAGNLRSVD